MKLHAEQESNTDEDTAAIPNSTYDFYKHNTGEKLKLQRRPRTMWGHTVTSVSASTNANLWDDKILCLFRVRR